MSKLDDQKFKRIVSFCIKKKFQFTTNLRNVRLTFQHFFIDVNNPKSEDLLGKLLFHAFYLAPPQITNDILPFVNNSLKNCKNKLKRSELRIKYRLFEAIYRNRQDIIKSPVYKRGKEIWEYNLWSEGKNARNFSLDREKKSKYKILNTLNLSVFDKTLNSQAKRHNIPLTWGDYFRTIMLKSLPNASNLLHSAISTFFEPNSTTTKTQQQKEDNYANECGIITLNLCEFLKNVYLKTQSKEKKNVSNLC